MERMFQAILEMSLFAIPVILVLALSANLLGKRYGAKWRYLLWLVVAVRLCVPMQISLPGRMEVMQLPSVESRMLLTERVPLADVQRETVELEPATPSSAEGVQTAWIELPNKNREIPPYLLWLCGVLGFLAWQGWKYYDFRRMLKRSRRKILDASVLDTYYSLCREMGLEKRPVLYFCAALPSPLCVGFFKTTVYLNSEERESAEMRLILKHELTHCKRKDLWFQGILLLARALHFFNPFVHGMARLAEKDMELSCDLAVMEHCGMAEREAYSMAILRTVREAKSKNMQLSTAFSGGKEELKMRFENIFDMSQKKRGIALFLVAVLVICGGTAFVGCADIKEEKTLSGTVYGAYTEEMVHELYAAKLQYIGDHIGVGRILGLLPLPEGVTHDSEGVELYTDAEPYGVRRHLQWQSNAETTYTVDGESYTDDRWMQIQGMIFLALVENAGDYNLSLHHADAADGQVVTAFGFDREQAKKYFGEQDLRDFASDEGTFRNFVLTINRYFYEGISTPEQILALSKLDAAAAQERMERMASGDFLDEEKEEKSLSYQMILADSLVGEIAAQKLTSSNYADYLNCTQYDELIKLGEPALRAFLSEFAERSIGDDLEGYIKASACRDILGEHRDKDVLLTPTEWYYRIYTATDSRYCAFFTYGDTDTTLYTKDLAKTYSMGGSDQYSVVAAGKDERLRAVYTALSDRFNNYSYAGYTTTIYAPLIEGIKENGNKMQVFAVIFDSTYAMSRTKEGYALFERGGSVIPSRLDFEKRNGKWILTEWTQAKDGSYYADSIKKMCDGDNALAKKMISYDNDACQMLLWQNMIYYMKANYGGSKLPIYFDSYMDPKNIRKISKYIEIIPTYAE